MPLPLFLQRLLGKAVSNRHAAEQPPLSMSDVEATRERARRRLIGMAVLVIAGIIGFPWLFETQPRPMSSDIQMVRVGDAPTDSAELTSARARADAGRAAMSQAPSEETPSPRQAQPPVREEDDEEIVSTAPPVRSTPATPEVSKPRVQPEVKPMPTPTPKSKPEAKPEPKPEPPSAKTADADGTRYVVQFGAFSDGITAHEARMKVERLGLKTYTQEVKTPQGTRIRVRMGPYANRAEAEKVLASLRKAGLGGAVLTL